MNAWQQPRAYKGHPLATMKQGLTHSILLIQFVGLLSAQEPRAASEPPRMNWVRPFADARARAKTAGRLMLVKPILGGTNAPDPDGLPCGGKQDCEGSW